MQYALCPRCKFKIAVNRHICAICGFDLQAQKALRAVNNTLAQRARDSRAGFWNKVLGIRPQSEEQKEPAHEEPALG